MGREAIGPMKNRDFQRSRAGEIGIVILDCRGDHDLGGFGIYAAAILRKKPDSESLERGARLAKRRVAAEPVRAGRGGASHRVKLGERAHPAAPDSDEVRPARFHARMVPQTPSR